MKNAKKVFAMLIVLALAISMAIPVSAEEDPAGTITISGASDNEIYKAYKMADLDYIAATQDSGAKYAYTVASNSPWIGFWTENDAATDAFTVTRSPGNASIFVIEAIVDSDSDEMVTFAKAAIAYAEGNDTIKDQAKTAVKSDGNMVISGLEDGYYVVNTTMGTLCSIDTLAGQGNVDIEEKNTIPQVDKSITNINKAASFNETDTATVKIGDVVEFTIEVPVEAGAVNYIVTDTLDQGLTLVLNAEGDVINNDDSDDENDNDDAFTVTTGVNYNLTVNGQEITFDINNEAEFIEQTITFKYYAKVNENAVVDDENYNTVVLEYGNNGSFTSDKVTVSPLSFKISKIDGTTRDPLSKAQFEIFEGSQKLKFTKQGEGIYLYDVNGQAVLESNQNGEINIKGLNNGTYIIKETKAPDGYNILLANKEQVISASFNPDKTLNFTAPTIEIENNTGTELPSTGATGTIIFITVGGLMVVAMGVLLVVRKRMSKVVYTR